MSRRTTQRTVAQSVILFIALLLFALAAVIAVRGMSHGSANSAGDAAATIVTEDGGSA